MGFFHISGFLPSTVVLFSLIYNITVVKILHQLRLRYLKTYVSSKKNESSPYRLMKDFCHVLLLVIGLCLGGNTKVRREPIYDMQ